MPGFQPKPISRSYCSTDGISSSYALRRIFESIGVGRMMAAPATRLTGSIMGNAVVVVRDKMQASYRYELSESEGQNFDPDFRPELTPPELLRLGIFGGKYMTDCRDEVPSAWFIGAKLSPERRDPRLNLFGVYASQPLSVWRDKGWLHKDDPRGWFQRYCRYYRGRRMEDDSRQIKRWKAMRRHVRQIERNCENGDIFCRRRQRQALLHWAYDSRLI